MKVFISQPMTGLTEEEIWDTRQEAIQNILDIYGEDTEILNSFCCDEYRNYVEYNLEGGEGSSIKIKSWEIYWLSYSLNYLAEADLIWFVDGWQHSKGCTIEHMCASLYGIETEYETLATRKDGSYKYGK